jgi:hypothetical protein
MQLGVENRDGETLLENILMEAMHDVFECDEIDKVIDDCSKKPASLYGTSTDNFDTPSFPLISTAYVQAETKFTNQHLN